MQLQRHIGKLKSSGADLVTVFLQISGKPDHALVVNLNNMGIHHRDILMKVVMSSSGQAHTDLADFLHQSRPVPNGETVLAMLKNNGYLRAVPVTDVIMFPNPNVPVPLTTLVNTGQLRQNGVPAPLAKVVPAVAPPLVEDQALRAGIDTNVDIANRLLAEAAQLRNDAVLKEQNAYAISPELAPKAKAVPPLEITAEDVPETGKVTLGQIKTVRKKTSNEG